MLRTQIYIPEKIHQRAKFLAKRQKRSLADLLRGLIEQGLGMEQDRRRDGLDAIVQLKITGGPKDLSEKLDAYLYRQHP